jgi:hypothetical protein
VGLNTILIGCGAIGNTNATAVGASAKALGGSSIAVGCGSCAQGVESISIGPRTISYCPQSVAIGCGNCSYSMNGNILGGYDNIICSGNTDITLIGVHNCTITTNRYSGGSSIVVVPDLAILSTPAGTGNILCWDNVTKRIGLTMENVGVTGATNGLSVDDKIVCLGGSSVQSSALIDLCNGANFSVGCYTVGGYLNVAYGAAPLIDNVKIRYINTDTNEIGMISIANAGGIIEFNSSSGDTGCQKIACFNYLSGFTYAACYHDDYSERSLVDKAYVDSKVSGGTSGDGITGATNGLSIDGKIVKLGGLLTQTTTTIQNNDSYGFSVNGYDVILGDVSLNTSRIVINSSSGDINIISGNKVMLQSSNITLNFDNPSGEIILIDEGSGEGIKYGADYSTNFVNRSLVDKAYVDSKVSGGTSGIGIMRIAKAEVLYTNTSQTTIITLPANAVIWNIGIEVVTVFDSDGGNWINIGITGSAEEYLHADVSSSTYFEQSTGGSDNSFLNNSSPINDKMDGSTNITYQHYEGGSSSTQGQAFVYIHYTVF